MAALPVWRRFIIVLNMTETRSLLADYAKNGSEAAFRELVARYIDLVYSTHIWPRLAGFSFIWRRPSRI